MYSKFITNGYITIRIHTHNKLTHGQLYAEHTTKLTHGQFYSTHTKNWHVFNSVQYSQQTDTWLCSVLTKIWHMAKCIQYSPQQCCFTIHETGVGHPCSLSGIIHQEKSKRRKYSTFSSKNQQVKPHETASCRWKSNFVKLETQLIQQTQTFVG
jgi:hypothetical protein